MAVASNSRRGAAGIAFIVAGALLLLATLLGFAAVGTGPWLGLLANLALAVGFAVLAVGSVANVVARVALIVAAVGFLLIALSTIVSLPAPIGTIAIVAAAIGGLVGAIVLYTGKEITDRSAVAFIVTMAIYAAIVLFGLAAVPLGILGNLLSIAFAVGLILTGLLFSRVQGSRRR
ncbi:hypothetical protein [Pseudolysinimonas sp.]|jgi:hypothetical protein|uniref:hypothetical protein n=1 Tax=Pseudolysinimonas sp. TaxID=2680009 RepID=UPI003783E55B